MKITRRQLKKLIQEAMSKEEMIGKLDKLAGSSDEGMMQAASLADALPRPETLDIDSSYEYRRKMINKLVTKRRNLAANLKDLSSDAGGMMSPVFQRAESYHDYRSHGQQYPDAHAFKMAEQDIQQEKAEVEDRIAKLDAQIQTLIDTLGMDPATAHISNLSEATIRRLMREVAIELSDNEISAAKQKLKDEGGAAGPEMIAKAVKDAEEGDAEASDEDVLDALMSADEEIVLHSGGDIIDTSGITAEAINQIVRETLEEKKKRKKSKKKKKITRKQLRRLIKEATSGRPSKEIYYATDDKYWKIVIRENRGRYYWGLHVLKPGAYTGVSHHPPELEHYTIIDDSRTYKPGYTRSLANCIEHMAYIFESDPDVNYNELSIEMPTHSLQDLVKRLQDQMRGGQGPIMEKKKRKKKKTKSKKRGYLYPYVYGHHDHDFHDYGYDVGDSGFDGGGDGGGGE